MWKTALAVWWQLPVITLVLVGTGLCSILCHDWRRPDVMELRQGGITIKSWRIDGKVRHLENAIQFNSDKGTVVVHGFGEEKD